MKTGIRVNIVLVLLLSLFVLSSHGASTKRGIGAAVVGGILDTQKAVYKGIAGVVGAGIKTGKEALNTTRTAEKSQGLLRDDDNITATIDEEVSTDNEVFSVGEERHNNDTDLSSADLVSEDEVILSNDTGVLPVEEEEGSGEDGMVGVFEGTLVGGGASDVKGTSDGGVEVSSAGKKTSSSNGQPTSKLGVYGVGGSFKKSKDGIEGRFGKIFVVGGRGRSGGRGDLNKPGKGTGNQEGGERPQRDGFGKGNCNGDDNCLDGGVLEAPVSKVSKRHNVPTPVNVPVAVPVAIPSGHYFGDDNDDSWEVKVSDGKKYYVNHDFDDDDDCDDYDDDDCRRAGLLKDPNGVRNDGRAPVVSGPLDNNWGVPAEKRVMYPSRGRFDDDDDCDGDDYYDDDCVRRRKLLAKSAGKKPAEIKVVNRFDDNSYEDGIGYDHDSHEDVFDDSRERGLAKSRRRVSPRRLRRSVGSFDLKKVISSRVNLLKSALEGKLGEGSLLKPKVVGTSTVSGEVDAAKGIDGDASNATSTAKPEEVTTSGCKSQDVCYNDSDCNGGKCIGPSAGTCNCNACFNFMTCTGDDGCGGLRGACDMTTKRCNCQEAHRKFGFANYFDAVSKFCGRQVCNGTSDACNGLPCSSGRCFC